MSRHNEPDEQNHRIRVIRDLGIQRDLTHLDTFIQAAQQPDPRLRAQACAAIGWLRHTAAIAPLTQSIGDESPIVRHAAISSLMHTPGFHESELMSTVMQTDGDEEVRARAARAIGYLMLECTEALLSALKTEESPLVVTQIVYALGRLRCTSAQTDIQALLESSNTALKIEAMRALTQLNVAGLDARPHLKSHDPLLRIEAIRSMAHIDVNSLRPYITELMDDENPGVRCALLIAVRNCDSQIIQGLLRALPLDPHPEVRRHQLEPAPKLDSGKAT